MTNRKINGRNRSKKKKKMIWIIVTLIILITCASGIVFAQSVNSKLDKIDYVKTPEGNVQFGIDSEVALALEGYWNIAILGVDSYQLTGEKYDGTRTDAILIASINKKTGTVKLLSVMRDSYLEVQEENGNYVLTKINHAHAYGGPMDTCISLNRNLDLNITDFVVFNWKSVADMVDAVGGVDLDVSANELNDLSIVGPSTARALGESYKPITITGIQHLDGVQATAYCRIRKTSGGDGARTERERETMTAIFKEASSLNFVNLGKLADEALPGIRTNITKTEMLNYMLHMRSYSIGESVRFPLQYRGGLVGDVWYAVPKNLAFNVTGIHQILFGQEDYVLSDVAQAISKKIIERTGFDL